MPRPSQEDLNKSFSKFHKIIRKKRAFKQVEQLSGINIEHQSQINILALYNRLREGAGLSAVYHDAISKEKKRVTDVLTPSELIFFEQLMTFPLIANHATEQADVILKNGANLYSSNQLGKHKIDVHTHTASHYGENHFVFFSYGFPSKINAVNFVGQADLFLVNLENLQVKDPALNCGMWSSGHFYAYDQEQVAMPVEYKFAGHTSRVYTRYEVTFTPMVEYNRHFVFQNEDGVSQQTLSREMEISAGRHIKPYHILRLIEFIRFLDPRMRQAILANGLNPRLMAELFDSVFSPGKAEIHIPEMLHVEDDPKIFSLQRWHDLNLDKNKLHACIDSDTTRSLGYETLEHYLKQNIALQFYRYNGDNKQDYSLLNLAVLKKRHDMVHLLLSYGASGDHTYRNEKQRLYRHLAVRSALQDAIEMHDSQMIKLLCELPEQPDKLIKIVFCASVKALDMYTAIAENLDKDTFLYLLSQYKNSCTQLDELLLVAIYYNNTTALKILLDAKANPNANCDIDQDDDNAHIIPLSLAGTALTFAAKHARISCLTILLPYANPNAYIKECGAWAKYGQGKSPIIVALENLFNCQDEDLDFGKVDNCRYINFQRPVAGDYHKTIELLIDAGANTEYRTGEGVSFLSLARKYLSTHKDDSFLKNIKSRYGLSEAPLMNSPKESKDYKHESYALITRFNDQKNQEELLIGEVMKGSEIRWGIPGGRANYQMECDLAGTVTNITGYQLGIDLSKDATVQPEIERYTNLSEGDDDLLELRHYRVPYLVKNSIYQDTPDAVMLSKKRGYSYIPLQFRNIRFIALEEITITLVRFKGTVFPLCIYKNKPLPYVVGIKIALLSGITNFDIQQAQTLAFQLHFEANTLFEQAVASGDLLAVKSLMQLKVNTALDSSFSLVNAMKLGNYEIAEYLLHEGVKFADANAFNSVYYQHEDQSHSEEITLLLYDAHKELLNSWLIESLAIYAGKKCYPALTDRLYLNDENILLRVAQSAVENGNFNSVKMVVSKVPLVKQDEFISVLLESCPSFFKSKDYESNFEIINFLITHYPSKKIPPPWLLDHVCSFYENIVKNDLNEALQKKCLFLIADLIKNEYVKVEVNAYNVYTRLKIAHRKHAEFSNKYLQAAENFLAVIRHIPAIAIRHASKEGLYHELDILLKKHHDNPSIKELLRENSYFINHRAKDAQGDSCLQRAVKANNLDSVKLLIDTCYNHSDFDINSLDLLGNTPLVNAQKLGHVKIANLLKVYTEVYTKSSEHLDTKKSGSNIICYGKIGRGQGSGHIIKLAQLIKSSDNKLVANKYIYVVGNIQKEKLRRGGTAYDKALYTLLKAMYPKREKDFYMKSPEELVTIFDSIKDEIPDLPIRLFLDVDEANLKVLLNECEYSVCASYRGVTLGDNSIRTSLACGNIIYSHTSDITPEYLHKDGEYSQAMVLFDERHGDAFANNILSDIQRRESNKIEIDESSYGNNQLTLNQMTRLLMKELINNYLTMTQAPLLHREIVMSDYDPMDVSAQSSLIGYENNGLFSSPEKNIENRLQQNDSKKRVHECSLDLV